MATPEPDLGGDRAGPNEPEPDLGGDRAGPNEPEPPSLTSALRQDLLEVVQKIPALGATEAQSLGGPIAVPPEQHAEAFRRQLEVILEYVPRIAAELDRRRWEAYHRRSQEG
jgi:hypothetical protein